MSKIKKKNININIFLYYWIIHTLVLIFILIITHFSIIFIWKCYVFKKKKNCKLCNYNYNKVYFYVEAIECESVDEIKKLTIKKNIALKFFKNNLLTVKRLKFIVEKCMNYLYISISLIKRLMRNNNVELLKIVFNSINFFLYWLY